MAIHSLIGPVLGDGIDWINRNNVSALATSVRRSFPSPASNFNWLQKEACSASFFDPSRSPLFLFVFLQLYAFPVERTVPGDLR